jgi:predicted ferric reductase
MTRLKIAFSGLAAAIALAWILSAWPFPLPVGYFPIRAAGIQFTGVVAMAAMSVAMILAMRPRSIEPWLDGLDKSYRLHKWLGIGALSVSIVHWLWAQGTKWAVGWGWLARPQRGPRPRLDGIEGALRGWRGVAETVGEWAFYAAAILIVAALLKAIPYRLFAKTHRFFPLAYLALVFHAVILLDFHVWATPLGVVMAALLAAGSWAAVLSLAGMIGAGRKSEAEVTRVQHFPALGVLAGEQRMLGPWPGHKPGQFAFVTADAREGAHPYTIASAWSPESRSLRFVAKALGDHTATLPRIITPGKRVTVEGPYGCFTFDDDQPAQIWVGAGIGVTPFIAAMEHLTAEREAGRASSRRITLFHSTTVADETALDLLRADAARAGVDLHILLDARDGYLTGDRIRQAVPHWRVASLWFCGPARFGASLRADFAAHGLDVGRRFHQELFEMR